MPSNALGPHSASKDTFHYVGGVSSKNAKPFSPLASAGSASSGSNPCPRIKAFVPDFERQVDLELFLLTGHAQERRQGVPQKVRQNESNRATTLEFVDRWEAFTGVENRLIPHAGFQ